MAKSNFLLDEIEAMTAEIHSLLKQGVKELSEKRIDQRQQKIELLFIHPDRITAQDQARLQIMLDQDALIKQPLEKEQQEYHNRNRKRSKLKLYKQNT
ncbi:MAG: hypothetical protein KBT75_02395 [Oleispira antarctica]|mgnify:FL=1|uniref:Uncharacterized protein n=1 Tax=Oleispira antarctica RB-8 TaxID=698738 RepID=R4YLG5_OLEAN|nr:hypothetical protein [Oleispira antarctica]MBQ0791513.1 hypothetical protein [Oleispira antarctica]CCK75375.1 hypothetical protein OLEAN_C11990 [Oleispira antarctica RB-8]|tara:strand:- start:1128 stop:1421 length:294 start_codon:yes stop_codon:yes gene_type:complete